MLLSGGAYLVLRYWGDFWGVRPSALLSLVPLAACLLFVTSAPRFSIAVASVAVVVTSIQDADRNVALRERNFFGKTLNQKCAVVSWAELRAKNTGARMSLPRTATW